MKRNDAERHAFPFHLTHQVMQAAFTFGPRSPMGGWIANGRMITRIGCTVEANEYIYDVSYTLAEGSHHARIVLPIKDDPVQKYICQRFNIAIFGEAVLDTASIDATDLIIDGVKADHHKDGSARNFFRDEITRMTNEKAVN